jgi:predicted O-methyltransferase YrrM
MQKLNHFLQYLNFLSRSINKFDIHSPFLYDLITITFEDKTYYPDYEKIEIIKSKLLRDKQPIEITDFGAGSVKGYGNVSTIAQIAKYSSKPKKLGRLMYRIAKDIKPKTILELGTSFGLTTAYMALGNPESKITSMEGCPNISSVANNNFAELNINNINLITGNFDDILLDFLENTPQLDLVFIDGNHREEPTIKYFEQCLSKVVNDSCMIFDDIYWSDEMQNAWSYIKKNEAVTMSVDLFHMGIIFFRKELTKQNFVIRF